MVLFDGIEKAHREVFNALPQILEDGRMTDGQGRTVDFKEHRYHHDVEPGQPVYPGFGWHKPQRNGAAGNGRALRDAFKPEFLNRVDEIIIFNSPGREEIKSIVEIQLKRLRQNHGEQKMALEITGIGRKHSLPTRVMTPFTVRGP